MVRAFLALLSKYSCQPLLALFFKFGVNLANGVTGGEQVDGIAFGDVRDVLNI